MSEWFEQWFGDEYLRLYPHRDDAEAAQAVSLLQRIVPLAGKRVLDLGCGPGRHARHLAAAGAQVIGFDLSMALLARARQGLGDGVALVRGDMRFLPFASHRFDLVVNLFTSFGYFRDDREHRCVIAEVADLLAPQGVFVLDFLNAQQVHRTLVAHEEQRVGSQRIIVDRRISDDGRFVIKEMHLLNDGRSFVERVRLFTAEALAALLTEAGLTVRNRFGDYAGGAFGPESPRAILVAERT